MDSGTCVVDIGVSVVGVTVVTSGTLGGGVSGMIFTGASVVEIGVSVVGVGVFTSGTLGVGVSDVIFTDVGVTVGVVLLASPPGISWGATVGAGFGLGDGVTVVDSADVFDGTAGVTIVDEGVGDEFAAVIVTVELSFGLGVLGSPPGISCGATVVGVGVVALSSDMLLEVGVSEVDDPV